MCVCLFVLKELQTVENLMIIRLGFSEDLMPQQVAGPGRLACKGEKNTSVVVPSLPTDGS